MVLLKLPRSIRKILVWLCILALLLLGWRGARAWRQSRSPKMQLEALLRVKLPNSASELHFWYYQVPGYYQADLLARFRLGHEEFLRMMQAQHVTFVGASDAWRLPTKFDTDPTVTWWNPPSDQPERFCDDKKGVWTIYVWHDGYLYVRKHGGFGSAW